jgi:hypothetical protein
MNPSTSVKTIRGYSTHPTKSALVSVAPLQATRLIPWVIRPVLG